MTCCNLLTVAVGPRLSVQCELAFRDNSDFSNTIIIYKITPTRITSNLEIFSWSLWFTWMNEANVTQPLTLIGCWASSQTFTLLNVKVCAWTGSDWDGKQSHWHGSKGGKRAVQSLSPWWGTFSWVRGFGLGYTKNEEPLGTSDLWEKSSLVEDDWTPQTKTTTARTNKKKTMLNK